MNLTEDEVLKMLKSGFGDVRAPRLWSDKAARDLCQIGFARHPLDRCVCMSLKGGDLPKSVSEGILGLHVDDFIVGGEGMSLARLSKDGTMCPWKYRTLLPGKMVENQVGIG